VSESLLNSLAIIETDPFENQSKKMPCGINTLPSIQPSPNKQTNVIVLTFVYYSLSAAYFQLDHHQSVVALCPNVDPD
jgi:hypothetical protein